MRRFLSAAIAATAFGTMTGAAAAQGQVVLYQWFEYIPQTLLEKFTNETGIKVVMDTYDSNESLLAALKAGALGTYDVAFPGNYMVSIMAEDGMLQALKPEELPGLANIRPEWAHPSFDADKENKYSLPYQWGVTSFAVNTEVYGGDINTTDILFNPPAELSGRINMFDSQGEVILLASLHLGIPQCSTDQNELKALNDLLQGAKKHWASFNSDTARELVVAGEVAASMMYDGWNAKAREQGAKSKLAFAKQGYVVWMDNVVLLKDAPNRENGLKFMDFLMQPENIAEVTNFALYGNGVIGSEKFMDPKLVNLPESNPPAEAGPAVFVEKCDQDVQAVYDRIWTNLKK